MAVFRSRRQGRFVPGRKCAVVGAAEPPRMGGNHHGCSKVSVAVADRPVVVPVVVA